MRTGWAGAICVQTLAVGSSHLQALLLTIFRMTVYMVLLTFIFILEFYVYEAYILTPNRFAATLMRNSSDNSTIVGVLVYTFLQLFIYFIYFQAAFIFEQHLFSSSMLPTILEGHKPHHVGNRACSVSRPAGSPADQQGLQSAIT